MKELWPIRVNILDSNSVLQSRYGERGDKQPCWGNKKAGSCSMDMEKGCLKLNIIIIIAAHQTLPGHNKISLK